MGHQFEAKCLDCGAISTVLKGGGFVFHLLHCDTCGETTSICFDDLGELHLRYLKGLPGPYCIATSEHDKDVQENADIEPISKKEYNKGVEKFAGKCDCGGDYTFDAPPRCSECRSTRLEKVEGGLGWCYD